jgi:hypothetical protein
MVSTDEGMQIDSSDKQCANAESPRLEMALSVSNVTDERESQDRKQPAEIAWISLPITRSVSFPKYQTRQVASKSIRKSFEIRKYGLAVSTATLEIPEPVSDKPVTSRRLAGR